MNEKTRYQVLRQREMMKGYTSAYVNTEATDQQQKLPFPQPLNEGRGMERIGLPLDFDRVVRPLNLTELIRNRESCRMYQEQALSLEELSFLLWSTQGVRRFAGRSRQVTFRNVPSAGSRHPFETYLFLREVEGIRPGIYHYLPAAHELEVWEKREDYRDVLTEALHGQAFAAEAPAVFVWSAVPYRTEWRYGLQAHKYMLLDAGHVCENLYLACEAIGCGTCAIGSYNQELLDELLGFAPGPSAEPDAEFVVYAASVGKKKSED